MYSNSCVAAQSPPETNGHTRIAKCLVQRSPHIINFAYIHCAYRTGVSEIRVHIQHLIMYIDILCPHFYYSYESLNFSQSAFVVSMSGRQFLSLAYLLSSSFLYAVHKKFFKKKKKKFEVSGGPVTGRCMQG